MSTALLILYAVSGAFIANAQANPIEHLIILMMENRSFDHYLGWLKELNPAINGLTGNEYNCVVPDDTSSECVTVSKHGYDTGPDDPDHSFDGTAEEIYGYLPNVTAQSATPKMNGFVSNAYSHQHDITNPMRMFSIKSRSARVLNTLAMEYAVFDNWFCSLPGPTDPNRAFAMSGSSRGMVDDYNGTQWTQQSYFDLLGKNNISWAAYWDATIWALGYFEDLTKLPNSKRIFPISQFYDDLKGDDLSSFIWLQPSSASTEEYGPPNWQHPDASMELGETLIQSVYESLRDSRYWNKSALVITFDEHGGFYGIFNNIHVCIHTLTHIFQSDHVTPPQTGVPPPDDIKAPNGFGFDRLGVRIPTVVVSPWIEKGSVIHNVTNGPTATSQYEGTSNIATANRLFGLDHYLGERHKWSATFDHIFLERDSPRMDAPEFERAKTWTIEDVKFQASKALKQDHVLMIQVRFMCDFLEIAGCPIFETQGEASRFLIERMPHYMSKIRSH